MKKSLLLALCLVPTLAIADDGENCRTMTTVPADEMTLWDVIELGLCRNPETASAYLSLESARFNKNAGYSQYLPSISASASASLPYRNREFDDWSYGASISASYLIFDFGKRLSDVNQLIDTWRATGFDYSESVQNYVYSVIGAYYALLNADADVATATAVQQVSKTAKDMADTKYKAGVVAKADVLKADVTLASSELDLERAKNNREIAKGTLLAKLSFPADQDIKIADMPAEFGSTDENKSIDELIEIAREKRPDLLRASANKDSAWHRRNSAFLSNLPTISASGSLSWNNVPSDVYNAGQDEWSGSIGIRASMPIFAGFSNMYNVRSAQANYERAIEQERQTTDNAMLDVFSAYQNYKTAQTVLKQTETLLASARETESVTASMYKVGKATMLDWQQALADLADAHKQNNAAKYDLFTKRAALALAIGDIRDGLRSEGELNETTDTDEQDVE